MEEVLEIKFPIINTLWVVDTKVMNFQWFLGQWKRDCRGWWSRKPRPDNRIRCGPFLPSPSSETAVSTEAEELSAKCAIASLQERGAAPQEPSQPPEAQRPRITARQCTPCWLLLYANVMGPSVWRLALHRNWISFCLVGSHLKF